LLLLGKSYEILCYIVVMFWGFITKSTCYELMIGTIKYDILEPK
jgi:hypothetical protein